MAGDYANFTRLAGFLTENLVALDIGCRWGFAARWDALGDRVTLIGFDADEEEITRLRAEFGAHENMRFFARTLGEEPSRAVLYRTREPGASSVFKPDFVHMSHLHEWEGWQIEGDIAVEVTTLDAWTESEGITRVDSMKLDTQGSELSILRGGEYALRTARHVEVEVAFNETNEGAPLFGEVDTFLRERGFALWRLRDLVHYALSEVQNPSTAPEEFWYQNLPQTVFLPGGQLVWCNAHFVRRDMYATAYETDWEARLRDALVAGVHGFNDLALLGLERLLGNDCPDEVRSAVAAAAVALRLPTTHDAAPSTTAPGYADE